MTPVVTVEVDDGVALVRLARPEKRNAMNIAMARDMHRLLGELDGTVRAIVVAGDDRAFSAGADLVEGGGADQPGITWFDASDRLAGMAMPTIAAIEGYCLGGGPELALCCDLRVAGRSAILGTPEVRHGVFPAGGATQRLPRLVGVSRAKELMLLGGRLDPATALTWGLVNRVVDDGHALVAAQELAREVAGYAVGAVTAIKALADVALDLALVDGLARERAALVEVLSSPDADEGAQAFRDRRREPS